MPPLALGGSPLGPILFFVLWNVIRLAFLWYTQEAGYRAGADISKDLSGGKLGKITEGASILGMFVIGALVERWVTISFKPVVSTIQQQAGAYIDWSTITGDAEGIKSALAQYASLGANGLDQMKVTTLQQNLDSLDPRPRSRGPHAVRVQAAEEERLADRHHPRPLWRGHRRPPHRPALGFCSGHPDVASTRMAHTVGRILLRWWGAAPFLLGEGCGGCYRRCL